MPSIKLAQIGAVLISAMASAKFELWGDGSSSLAIQNESKKIKKGSRKPVIIYVVSPKTIHVEAGEFMSLVQQLTGLASSPPDTDGSMGGDVDAGRRCTFPVKVEARRVPQRQGTAPSVFGRDSRSPACDAVEEGGLMDTEDWFKW